MDRPPSVRGWILCIAMSGCGGGGSPSDGGLGDGGSDAGRLVVGPTCEAFCNTGMTECQLLIAGTVDRCEQGCESDLVLAREDSETCADAFEAGFECTSELSCDGFSAWLSQQPPDSFPCRAEVVLITAECSDG